MLFNVIGLEITQHDASAFTIEDVYNKLLSPHDWLLSENCARAPEVVKLIPLCLSIAKLLPVK